MLTKVYLYQKNVKTNEHILVIKNKVYLDMWSIDTKARKAKRHHPKCNNATLRAMQPLFMGAYKQLDLGKLEGYLLSATAQALGQVRLS